MVTAVYVRTSTKDQHGEAQRHAITKALDARGITDARWYVELGQSGAKEERPKLRELTDAIHCGEVSQLFVYALDRLGRSLGHLIRMMDSFRAAGCTVVSIRESLDLSTPAGVMQMQVMGALAQFERGIIQERVQSGVDRAREHVKLGRPNRVTPRQLEDARRLRRAGHSFRYVAKSLGVPVGSLHRALSAGDAYEYVAPGKWRADALRAV